MGELTDQNPVKLIASIIYKDENSLSDAESFLVQTYGEQEDLEAVFPFDFTDYYEEEFGKGLKRKLVCFRKLIEPDGSGRIKLSTNLVEHELKNGEKRTVNIDPGYITEAKLILFTTKDYSHRVYLGNKIFAEVTLYFQNSSFRSWPWTYPDYASEALIGYFNKVRALYMNDIRGHKGNR
jgi:hypothetical protein